MLDRSKKFQRWNLVFHRKATQSIKAPAPLHPLYFTGHFLHFLINFISPARAAVRPSPVKRSQNPLQGREAMGQVQESEWASRLTRTGSGRKVPKTLDRSKSKLLPNLKNEEENDKDKRYLKNTDFSCPTSVTWSEEGSEGEQSPSLRLFPRSHKIPTEPDLMKITASGLQNWGGGQATHQPLQWSGNLRTARGGGSWLEAASRVRGESNALWGLASGSQPVQKAASWAT